jgi:hypothetical protein
MKRYRKQLRWVAIAAAYTFAAVFLSFAILEMIYFDGRPREPHPDAGLTIPYVVKNRMVFITATQAEISYWSYRVFLGALCVLAACGIISGGDLDMRRNSN